MEKLSVEIFTLANEIMKKYMEMLMIDDRQKFTRWRAFQVQYFSRICQGLYDIYKTSRSRERKDVVVGIADFEEQTSYPVFEIAPENLFRFCSKDFQTGMRHNYGFVLHFSEHEADLVDFLDPDEFDYKRYVDES